MGEVIAHESWNKKRIFIAVFLLSLLMIGGYFFKASTFKKDSSQGAKSVKGISEREDAKEPELKVNIQEAVKEKINSLKQEVAGLDVMEISSSSPQVQKILSDIKFLEQYPANQAKEICREIYKKVCGL